MSNIEKAALQYELEFYTKLLANHGEQSKGMDREISTKSIPNSTLSAFHQNLPTKTTYRKKCHLIQNNPSSLPSPKIKVTGSNFYKQLSFQNKSSLKVEHILQKPKSLFGASTAFSKTKNIDSSKYCIVNNNNKLKINNLNSVSSSGKTYLKSVAQSNNVPLSNSQKLMGEIMALTQQLKQKSENLSSCNQKSVGLIQKQTSALSSSSKQGSKNVNVEVKSVHEGQVTMTDKFNLPVSVPNSHSDNQPKQKPLVQSSFNSLKQNKSRVSNTPKNYRLHSTRLIVNKKSNLNFIKVQKNDFSSQSFLKTSQMKVSNISVTSSKKRLTKDSLLCSKYKVNNLKPFPCTQAIVYKKDTLLREKFQTRYTINNAQRNLVFINSPKSLAYFNLKRKRLVLSKTPNTLGTKVHSPVNWKINRSALSRYNAKSVFTKKPTSYLKRVSPRPLRKLNSKYQVFNSKLNESEKKISSLLKIPTSKVCDIQNKGMDLDLLIELAAEKNSSNLNRNHSPVKSQPILVRRIYKSNKTLINKNSSLQTKVAAKMIKSKYLFNKVRWQKRALSKWTSKSFSKGLSYPRLTPKLYFSQNQKLKRNYFPYKNSPIISKSRRSLKYFNYYQSNRCNNLTYFCKNNIRGTKSPKFSSPVSKSLASRAVNRSINRVLTASARKKTAKVNTYCMFYNRFGRCNKGLKCTYVHDPSKIAVCTRFIRGTCKIEHCPFSHEICPGKMAICSFYLLGTCTKTNCPYRHEALPPEAKLCKAFVQGYCPEGKKCKQAHVLVCPQYVQGFCEKGKECPFPHPPPKGKKNSSELKSEVPKESEELFEKVARYFEINDKEDVKDSVVPRRQKLPEQPSFIALT